MSVKKVFWFSNQHSPKYELRARTVQLIRGEFLGGRQKTTH